VGLLFLLFLNLFKIKTKIHFMIILIILTALLVFGVRLFWKSYSYDFIGIVLAVCAGLYLFFHIVMWALASYNYNIMNVKRASFIQTLENTRSTNNPIELAAITKDISEWNQELAAEKYNNTVYLLQDYTDDRIMSLEPIK
jgi:CBS domain containing-hemolysin-like protein